MGFCWGGAVTNQVAVNAPISPRPFPSTAANRAGDVPKIKAAMLIHYAGDDERINAGIPAFEEALKKASVEHTIHMYEGAGHAFMNDTGSATTKRRPSWPGAHGRLPEGQAQELGPDPAAPFGRDGGDERAHVGEEPLVTRAEIVEARFAVRGVTKRFLGHSPWHMSRTSHVRQNAGRRSRLASPKARRAGLSTRSTSGLSRILPSRGPRRHSDRRRRRRRCARGRGCRRRRA